MASNDTEGRGQFAKTLSVKGPQCAVTVEIACTRTVDNVMEITVCRIIGHKYDEFVCTRCGRNAFDA